MIPLRKLSRHLSREDHRKDADRRQDEKEDHSKLAVIVVGSAGAGKSSTIAKCTGHGVPVGDTHQSVTRHCEIYETLADHLP